MYHLHLSDEFPPQVWKFESLRNPAMRQRAVKVAADSDIVILSAHGCGKFPGEVQNWLRDWFRTKEDHPCSLIALLDDAELNAHERRSVISRLRTTTRKAGVEFFYWMFQQPVAKLRCGINVSPATIQVPFDGCAALPTG
jgi:hypothetical protein